RWFISIADDVDNSAGGEHLRPGRGLKPAEHVPGKERKAHRLPPVGPPVASLIERQVDVAVFYLQLRSDGLLMAGSDMKRMPAQLRFRNLNVRGFHFRSMR